MNENKKHFQWIDFLRGIAALGIVLFHVRVDLWVGWEAIHHTPGHFSKFDHLAALLALPTPFFGSAVMLFFLSAGFAFITLMRRGARWNSNPTVCAAGCESIRLICLPSCWRR